MLIRRAEPDDAAALSEIARRAYGPYVELIGARPWPIDVDYAEAIRRDEVHVGDDGNGPVAYVVLVQKPDHLLLDNVAVEPAHQGEGIGRALLGLAEQRARAGGLPEVRLYTHALMSRNRALYARAGYREVEQRQENGFDRVVFAKRLA